MCAGDGLCCTNYEVKMMLKNPTLMEYLIHFAFLFVYAECTDSKIEIHITPSPNISCPHLPCLTLQQFSANSSSYHDNMINGSLVLDFLHGNHILDRELSLVYVGRLSMTMGTQQNGSVIIQCTSQSARLNISEITFALIFKLHFSGCGSNKFTNVDELLLEDAIFHGEEERGPALILTAISLASIVKCSFISNTHLELNHVIQFSGLENVLGQATPVSKAVSGALYATFSNVIINNTNFSGNTALLGAAVATIVTNISIINVQFLYNEAQTDDLGNFGYGVIFTHESNTYIDNSNFSHNSASVGGILVAFNSRLYIVSSTFNDNSASTYGGVMTLVMSSITITNSSFMMNNAGQSGGVLYTLGSMVNITGDPLTDYSPSWDGQLPDTFDALFSISNSTFTNNDAFLGGVMYTSKSLFSVAHCVFTNNDAGLNGGVMFTAESSFNISSSTFTNNNDIFGSGAMLTTNSLFSIIDSVFTGTKSGVMTTIFSIFNVLHSNFTNNINRETGDGAAMYTSFSSFAIVNSSFTNNLATGDGGAMFTALSSFSIKNCDFGNNRARNGGVMDTRMSTFNITCTILTNNSAARAGGVIITQDSSFNITDTVFTHSAAGQYGGIMFLLGGSIDFTNCTFENNSGSLYVYNINITFRGYTHFESNIEPNKTENVATRQEGGAITAYQSNVLFTKKTSLLNNQARRGGAMLTTESMIRIHDKTIIANNVATESNGGGIFLQQSMCEIKGNCSISNNHAVNGGGFHVTSSSVSIYQQGSLEFVNNSAELNGGGMYLQTNPRVYMLKTKPSFLDEEMEKLLVFTGNSAMHGGAMYVADDTNILACLPSTEYLIQTLALYQLPFHMDVQTENLIFSENTAVKRGPNLFGGLLDRCIPSPFAEVYQKQDSLYDGVAYLGDISNITLDSIASLAIRVCFCKRDSQPDCSYQPLPIKVQKGELFKVSLVAVDNVNNTVDANITSSIVSSIGGLGEGQHSQEVMRNCTDLTFSVFSPDNLETIELFAEGPCGRSTPSVRQLSIQFLECICPIGFKSTGRTSTRCECICDPALFPHIKNCNYETSSIFRVNTRAWISWITHADPPGFVIHPYCPFDYCHPGTENISINFDLLDGEDSQCAYNRGGVICGTCRKNLSLSLGSSHCLPCYSYWPATFVVILLAAITAGILLVTALLVLNMTVAVGMINGFILYANIIAAGSAVFFPSSEPSFPSVFVAWLNLDIGLDVCFFDGLDAYAKIWLQLVFPVYIISLVIIVIIVSEHSPRFAGLIGKKDPVATLATLILLSYAKLLSITIAVLSFVVLRYPDGSQQFVWLLDGEVKYFHGKHIALVVVALFIILIGLPYTILLFLWQWLVKAPRWKVFMWIRNTKLNAFIATYHAPYNTNYRYWTGLLLLVRVVLYITAAITVSVNPQTFLLMTIILVGGLLFLKQVVGMRQYRKVIVDIFEMIIYFNLIALATFSLYDFKTDIRKQTAVAYISTIITLILFIGAVIYHLTLIIHKTPDNMHKHQSSSLTSIRSPVTRTTIDISPKGQYSPTYERDTDETTFTTTSTGKSSASDTLTDVTMN